MLSRFPLTRAFIILFSAMAVNRALADQTGGAASDPAPGGQKITSQRLEVKSGKRAVSINVDARTGLEGHAKPGSLVDVALTWVNADGELKSCIIGQKARVLSYGGKTDITVQTGGAPRVEQTITLEVEPEEALKVITAKELGLLSLLMRDPGDGAVLGEVVLCSTALLDEAKQGSRPDLSEDKYCPWRPGSRVRLGTKAPRPRPGQPPCFPDANPCVE